MPLTKWLKSFPPISSLHPFESALLDLTVGSGTYASVLGKVDTLRKALQEVRASVVLDACVCIACIKQLTLLVVLPSPAVVHTQASNGQWPWPQWPTGVRTSL